MPRKKYINPIIGSRILGVMVSPKHPSNESFAKAIGVRRETLESWYREGKTPDLESLVNISREANVSVDYLLGLSDARSLDADVQNACHVTGLSEESVAKVNGYQDGGSGLGKMILNKMIESEHFDKAMNYLLLAYAVKGFGVDKDDEGASVVGYNHDGNGGIILSTEESILFYISIATKEIEELMRDLLLR